MLLKWHRYKMRLSGNDAQGNGFSSAGANPLPLPNSRLNNPKSRRLTTASSLMLPLHRPGLPNIDLNMLKSLRLTRPSQFRSAVNWLGTTKLAEGKRPLGDSTPRPVQQYTDAEPETEKHRYQRLDRVHAGRGTACECDAQEPSTAAI